MTDREKIREITKSATIVTRMEDLLREEKLITALETKLNEACNRMRDALDPDHNVRKFLEHVSGACRRSVTRLTETECDVLASNLLRELF